MIHVLHAKFRCDERCVEGHAATRRRVLVDALANSRLIGDDTLQVQTLPNPILDACVSSCSEKGCDARCNVRYYTNNALGGRASPSARNEFVILYRANGNSTFDCIDCIARYAIGLMLQLHANHMNTYQRKRSLTGMFQCAGQNRFHLDCNDDTKRAIVFSRKPLSDVILSR